METLRVRQDGSVTRLTLARPAVKNAFNDALVRELAAALAGLSANARCLVVDAEGDTFCAGADLAWMKQSADNSPEQNVDEARTMQRMFRALDECPVPVIAKVQGAALGGGSGLIACCDIVVASTSAVFGFSEVRLGLAPAVISPFVLRKIGAGAARRYFLTGERFDAHVALRVGLVHELAAPTELDATVERLAAQVASSGPAAVRAAKRLIRDVMSRPGEEMADYTAQLIAALRASPEGREGLSAFLEKRKAAWA
jgi:methylglutaconyl-CoA hydratase